MNNKVKLWSVFFWLMSFVICLGQGTDYLARLLPSGVSIGIDGAQVRASRNEAIQRALPEKGGDPENNYDLIERSGPATISWYYIRNGALSGYMRTTKTAAIGRDQQQAERELIIPGTDSGFVKESEEQALRAGQDLDAVIISASRWKPAVGNLRLYTVSTNQEITAVIFNPSELSRDVFFASPDLKKGLDEQAQTIKNKLGIKERPSVNGTQGQSQTGVETTSKEEAVTASPSPPPQPSLAPMPQASPTRAERPAPKEEAPSSLARLYLLAVIILGGIGFVFYRSSKR